MEIRKSYAVAGIAGLALLAAGCSSSGSDSSSSSTPTPATTSASPSSSPTQTSSNGDLPKPPANSTELSSKTLDGGTKYARYSNSDKTPKEVIESYSKEVKADGYKVTDENGGGGGWGGYGGSDYGMQAEKSGSYFNAQAGGSEKGPTYFEVCLGSDKSAVDKCEKHSKDSNSGGS